jgi:outer membrane protein assembly factor BamB
VSGGLRGFVLVCACALGLVIPALSGATDWPRYGGDDRLTNNVPGDRAGGLSSETAENIVERWSAPLGGRFVASPLFAENVAFGNRQENVAYAATNAGTVAALRAEDGTVLWKRQVSGTVATCNGTYGISSSPILDRGRNRLYVIGADGLLSALDLSTGATLPGWPVRITSLNDVEYAWGGLSMYGTHVYVPIASYCDKPNADGYYANGQVVAVDVVDARVVATFDTVDGPNNMGGVWGYAGVSIDATGHLWAATGNAWQFDAECGCTVETTPHGESLLELDPDLNLIASNQPDDIAIVEDSGFGAAPLLFQPPGCPPLAAANAKNGKTYIWNRENIADGPIWSARVGPGELGASFVAQPSYSPDLKTFFISAARDYDDEGTTRNVDAVVGFAVGDGCSIPARPTWTAPGVGRGPKSPPLVVDDVVFVPGGFDRNVFALDANTGETLWSMGLPGAALAPIAWARDEILVGDSSGVLHAFGLVPRTVGTGKFGLFVC